MTNVLVRPAVRGDLPALVAIYNHAITHGHATFETAPQTVESRAAWLARYGDGAHQLLVAEHEGVVRGYCSSSPYRPTPAFDTTVELSVYLDPAWQRQGTGTALYTALFGRLQTQPVHLAVAGVALPNDASLALHRKLGFTVVGTFREYARKHGAWISSTWLQRPIGAA